MRRVRPALACLALALALAGAAACAVLAGSTPPQAAPEAASALPSFDRWFTDATLRIDYVHVGHAKDELVTLDKVYRQRPWAGSRRHLVDALDNGGYYVKVYDAATNELLFSRGFDSTFGEYRTSGPALEGVRRAYHESALVPAPRKPFVFALESRGRDKALKEIFRATLDPNAFTVIEEPPPAGIIVVEALRSGDPHAKVDLAILGEGYTAAEEPKFRHDLARYVDLMFSQEPWRTHRADFNVYGVLLPSRDSGCDEPSRGVYRNTALGASFDALGSERYLLTEDNKALRDVASAVPCDVLYVMVNHSRYGGGGIYNLFCTFTSDNQWSPYVFLHEFGHAFAGLADEYYTSAVAYNEFYPRGVEPTEPNITALLAGRPLKWQVLVTPGTPVPTPWEKKGYDELDRGFQKVREEKNGAIAAAMRSGAPAADVQRLKDEAERLSKEHAARADAYLAKSAFVGRVGAFEGAGYASEGLYRSSLDCIMFSKGTKPFCKACARGIERVIERYTE